jgi:anti-sigma-K factor RskA
MNCVELQQSLAEVDDASTAEQRAHVRSCPTCAALVKELNQIIAMAGDLRAADEPSPRVWANIEAGLRQEGLIRPVPRPFLPSLSAGWRAVAWLVPAAAMLLLSLGIYVHRQPSPLHAPSEASISAPAVPSADAVDSDLLQEIAQNSPAMKTQFEENLRQVNQAIVDSQGWVAENPNDSEARRSLLDAYHQKSMLFELAMDRSLQ